MRNLPVRHLRMPVLQYSVLKLNPETSRGHGRAADLPAESKVSRTVCECPMGVNRNFPFGSSPESGTEILDKSVKDAKKVPLPQSTDG